MSKPAVNDRIAARRAAVRGARRRRRLRRTILASTALVLLVGGWLLERSSLVALATAEVTGVQRLTADEVRATGGVALGTSVLRLRPSHIEDRIQALPMVERAVVERAGSLGLRIEIVEVAPALTAIFGEEPWLVSEDGLVLGRGDAPGTPHVFIPGRAPAEGERVATRQALATAHAVLLSLPGPIAVLVDSARAVTSVSIELDLKSGVVVRWGDGDRADEKARALGAVLEDLDGLVVTAIDVRAPAAPTVTP
ncbi:MAG: cell division septal protein FtsQ [Myxococcota bacterium]|jgi:cell division septal protein FtsQ